MNNEQHIKEISQKVTCFKKKTFTCKSERIFFLWEKNSLMYGREGEDGFSNNDHVALQIQFSKGRDLGHDMY